MVQIIKSGPSTVTMRQQALDQAFGNIAEGIGKYQQQEQANAQTMRQQALQAQDTAFKLREAGYDVTPEQVAQSQAPAPQQGFFDRLIGKEMPVQERPDLFAKRTDQYNQKQELERAKYQRELESSDLDRKTKESTIRKNEFEMGQTSAMAPFKRQREQADLNKTIAETNRIANEGKNGKQMSAADVGKYNEGNRLPGMLTDLRKSISSSQDMFGPVAGRVAGFNPYNEKAKTLDSQLRTSAQSIGSFLEGGVLRKEDEEKYAKMLPQLSDTPEIASNKLDLIEKLLVDKQRSTVDALKNSGYDTAGIQREFAPTRVPEVLGKNQGYGNASATIDQAEVMKQVKAAGLSREEKLRQLRGK